MNNLALYAESTAKNARQASRGLTGLTGRQKNDWLGRVAELIGDRTELLIAANQRDIENAPKYGLNAAAVDRLRLSPSRLTGIADSVREIASLPDPVGESIEGYVRPNGLIVNRVRVPLGVVFFIYESRPNVTIDAAALCVKSGNAVILRGGKEAFHSNQALQAIVHDALVDKGLPTHAVQLVETLDREAVGHFLKLHESIDVTIPRGGKALIERVAQEAAMPVIKHFDGNCHTYVDEEADLTMAVELIVNGKCQRPGVCNATESVIVHQSVARELLPRLGDAMRMHGVEMRCCDKSLAILPGEKPATAEDFATEYLDLIVSIKVVGSLQDAIDHINEFGSHHTDCIVTNSLSQAREFVTHVDSASVHVNASTRFNDGGELGLGAEIGISTDKFHARGPCGLRELTSYKYVVEGSGQIKE